MWTMQVKMCSDQSVSSVLMTRQKEHPVFSPINNDASSAFVMNQQHLNVNASILTSSDLLRSKVHLTIIRMDSMDIDDTIFLNRNLSVEGLVTRVDFQRRQRPSRCVAVCLGLLSAVLLAGNVGQFIYYEVMGRSASGFLQVRGDRLQGGHDASAAERTPLEAQLGNLTEEKDQLQQSYSAERDALNASFNNLRNDRDQLQATFNALKQESDQLQTSYNDMQSSLEGLQADHKNLKAAKDQLQTNYQNLQREKDQLQTNYQNLQRDINELQTSSITLRANRDQLQSNYSSLKITKDQLQISYNALKQESDQLQTSYNDMQSSLELLQANNTNLKATKDQLQTNYQNLQREKDKLQTSSITLRANRDQLQSNYSSLKIAKDQLQISYKTLSLSQTFLQSRYTSLAKDKDRLQSSYNSLQRNKEQLQNQYSRLANVRDELEKKISQVRGKPCQPGWRRFDVSCYLVSTEKKNWMSSRDECVAEGSDLVAIDSLDEQVFINGLLPTGLNAWIGLTDAAEEGVWTWADGTPVNTTFWEANQPNSYNGNQDCGEIVQRASGPGEWNDEGCFVVQNFICER